MRCSPVRPCGGAAVGSRHDVAEGERVAGLRGQSADPEERLADPVGDERATKATETGLTEDPPYAVEKAV